MVNGLVPFRHHLLQIVILERVSQVPSDARENNNVLEVSPVEERWPFSGHDTPYQNQLSRICNRTEEFLLDTDG
jgi:hypothetical protein